MRRRLPASQPLAHAVPEPASAIHFALEFGCAEILPAAFYQLARSDVAMDWDNPTSYTASWDTPVRWSLLAVPDLLRCLLGLDLRSCGRQFPVPLPTREGNGSPAPQ